MWFENPFSSNEADNLSLLLKNLGGKQAEEKKRSTTVDVWRGNYDDYIKPKPRITIIKKYQDPKDEIATVKTLYPDRDAPGPTPRTLLCHHATDKSGLTSCTYPGKCNYHKLTKPAASEVSKIDQCRTVIDLYEQGVMSGVINANQKIDRDSTNQRYAKEEYGTTCVTHANCCGDCGSHGPQKVVAEGPQTLKPQSDKYTPDTRPSVSRQLVVARKPAIKSIVEPRLTTYQRTEASERVEETSKKTVTFNNKVKVKCVNPSCGRLSILGESCDSEIIIPKPETTSVRLPQPPISAAESDDDTDFRRCKSESDLDNQQSCTDVKLLPSCYYQHARQRMKRLKDKSKSLVESTYAAPSSLAKGHSLVKRYNNAKQNNIKRKKFVIPNVDADCLYQPTRPRRPRPPPLSLYTTPGPRRPTQYNINMREIYPKKRSGKMKLKDRSKGWDSREELGPTIKVAVDEVGPLVFAVQNGKIQRMRVEGSSKCKAKDDGGPCRIKL